MQMNQPIRAGRLILTLAALILCALNSSAKYFYYTYEGQTLLYTTLDDYNTVRCEPENKNISGDLIIPEEVIDEEGQTYKVTEIGSSAFFYCLSLTAITIPNSVIKIGSSAFGECSSLTSVSIGNSVTEIGSSAFRYCTSITSVTIPNSVTKIGVDAFDDCYKLTAVYISDLTAWCNISFENSFANPLYNAHNLYINGNLLTDLVIPNSVTNIGENAFYDCRLLTSVTIPDSISKISASAFYGCSSLKNITLPESVNEIGFAAFVGAGLRALTILNPNPPSVQDNAFLDPNPENIALYVPAESVELYRKTEPWSRFKSVNAVDTAIKGVEVEADVAVSVCGAEIIVPEGSKIFDLKGRAMRATKLPVGVYIVRTPSGKTFKVTIAL